MVNTTPSLCLHTVSYQKLDGEEGLEMTLPLIVSSTHAVYTADYSEAVGYYTEALKMYPPDCKQEIAVCYANRAACHLKLVRTSMNTG